jgi:hypothetical protein
VLLQGRGGFDEMLEGESPAPREKETAQTFKRRSINVDLQKCILFVMNICAFYNDESYTLKRCVLCLIESCFLNTV